MNKNSRARQRQLRKWYRSSGGWPKTVFKPKSSKFPAPNGEGMALIDQRKLFYGFQYKQN